MVRKQKKEPQEREKSVSFDGQVVLKLKDNYPRTAKQHYDPARETVTMFLTLLREGKPRSAVKYLRNMNVLTRDGFKLPRSGNGTEAAR